MMRIPTSRDSEVPITRRQPVPNKKINAVTKIQGPRWNPILASEPSVCEPMAKTKSPGAKRREAGSSRMHADGGGVRGGRHLHRSRLPRKLFQFAPAARNLQLSTATIRISHANGIA